MPAGAGGEQAPGLEGLLPGLPRAPGAFASAGEMVAGLGHEGRIPGGSGP